MKVVAHPLVVAAALGLIGPSALESLDEPERASTEKRDDLSLIEEAPSPEEFSRIEQQWYTARLLVE